MAGTQAVVDSNLSGDTAGCRSERNRIAILHRGHILAEGTLDQLRDEHHERDLEELFFNLISRHDAA